MFILPLKNEQAEREKGKQIEIIDDDFFHYLLSPNDPETKRRWERLQVLNIRNSKITFKSIKEMCESPYAERIKELDLSKNFNTINNECLKQFANSKYLKNIETLNLSDTEIDDEGLIAFMNSHNFTKIKSLTLYGQYRVTNKFLDALSKKIVQINYLDLRCTFVNDDGLRQYLASHNSQFLQFLDLSMNFKQISDSTVHNIAKNSLNFLQVLRLSNCKITNKGIEYLCQSESSQNLIELDIGNDKSADYEGEKNSQNEEYSNEIDDRALESIKNSNFMNKLEILNLRFTQITDKGIGELLKSPNVEHLTQLRLSWNRNITKVTLKSIIEAQNLYLKNIKKVYVNDTGVDNLSVKQFVEICPLVELIYQYTISIMNRLAEKNAQNSSQSEIQSQLQSQFITKK